MKERDSASAPTLGFYAGYVGTALLSISLVAAAFGWYFGWRNGAIIGAAALGYVVYAVLVIKPAPSSRQ